MRPLVGYSLKLLGPLTGVNGSYIAFSIQTSTAQHTTSLLRTLREDSETQRPYCVNKNTGGSYIQQKQVVSQPKGLSPTFGKIFSLQTFYQLLSFATAGPRAFSGMDEARWLDLYGHFVSAFPQS